MTGEGSMHGYLMYEAAKQRIAEQQRAAQQVREAREARAARAAARGRRARKEAAEAVATPVIPDFADEMFESAQETTRGRHARSGR